ncbi:MAG: hypothetical protein AAGA48_01460 [Myxococcota bacterium]
MAARKPPNQPEIDPDTLSTLVDEPAPDFLEDYEEADTKPGTLPRSLAPPAGSGGGFEEAETDAQPLGLLDGAWPDESPSPDPFGEAETEARPLKSRFEEIATKARPRPTLKVDSLVPPALLRKGDAEATIRVPSEPPEAVRSLRAAERPDSTGLTSKVPRRAKVDPEQALGFMTVGLVVGLGLSALIGTIIVSWLFASQ